MMTPNLPGTWTVTVQNDDGTTLRQDTLVVDPIMPAEPAIPAVAPLAPVTPAIPAPAQPLTAIPPDIRKEAAERSATVTPTPTSSNSSTQAIWDKLPR
jgi:hypothetical protein